MAKIFYITLCTLFVAIICESNIETNLRSELESNSNTESLAIRSFTAKVTKPTQNPEKLSKNITQNVGKEIIANDNKAKPAFSEISKNVTFFKTTKSSSQDFGEKPGSDNGVYRIKLAEIITNNFVGAIGGRSPATKDSEELLHTNSNKINIIDLYPSEVKDFQIITRDLKAEKRKNNDDNNMLQNEINTNDNIDERIPKTKIDIELIDNGNKSSFDEKETDITGEVQRKDGVITEIEKKFQLEDLKSSTQSSSKVKYNGDFIDRRVKKSFKVRLNGSTLRPIARVDFANTKFNTDTKDNNENRSEFSTTKFYNGKENYNEYNNKKDTTTGQLSANLITIKPLETATIANIRNLTTIENISTLEFDSVKNLSMEQTSNSPLATTKDLQTEISLPNFLDHTILNLNGDGILRKATLNHETTSMQNSQSIQHKVMTTIPPQFVEQSFVQTKPTPTSTSTVKSLPRPRVLTRLEEKINSLECDLPNLQTDVRIWRGNETHELLLPLTTPESCKDNAKCSPMAISWEGQAEIQSGDVLIVEINDSLLTSLDFKQTPSNSTHKSLTTVYQVTRPGHEHCDVTEGILLDITPLVVDGRKIVTLYDKDLTEGVNLLIVVSELWGEQCIRLKVTVKSDNCGENADCSEKGICFSNTSMEGYECQCCNGFTGSHCEEIDACYPSPCTNNGICVDLSQGHEGSSYQCLCPYGYTGKNCQYESDPCIAAECLNGGTCIGNSTHFRCECASGYTGPLCQHNLNECESSPCVHGICVDQEDGFRCFCQPGFSGELCNYEYNECESNPCLNSGQCVDQIGGFECRCTKGYTGKHCHIKVNFCANSPCPDSHRCIDRGDDFICECPDGRNEANCNEILRVRCDTNHCSNGGTCWFSEDSFYCACRPGYTGKLCEDEFVVETVVSSNEFMTDDTSTGNFNNEQHGISVSKSPVELHNAYIAMGTLTAAIFIVAIVVTICHCKVHQTYKRFSNSGITKIPIFRFGRKLKSQKSTRHWLSGKGDANNLMSTKSNQVHLPATGLQCHNHHIGIPPYHRQHQHIPSPNGLNDHTFQRHLAMNLENDMYYTVDFSESHHSPLIK